VQASRFDTARLERIDSWMRGHVAAQRLPGLAVQIARPGGEVVFSRCHGFADAGTQRPIEPDTIYRIYSMTKPVTSLAALMLYEEGRFQLDQPVADFIPSLAGLRVWAGPGSPLDATVPLARPVTVHDLMTHQAGFVYGTSHGNALEQAYDAEGLDFDRPGDTVAAAVARLARLPLLFQPGARWFYGLSTDVLGHLVEVVSGQTLGAFFRERILAPLGMADTTFALPGDHLPRLATLYAPASASGGLKPIATPFGVDPRQPVTAECGGAGLYSTMDDYQRFASMLLARGAVGAGRLLGRKTFDMMVTNQMGGDLASRGQAHFTETTMEGIGFGLGVSVMLDPVRAKVLGSPGEFSWGGMASTTFFVDPVEQFTVILMTQLVPSSTYTLRRQLRVLTYQALI
jgi:CubicO group peptidase (beta-lactamase class C family)